MDSLKEYEFHIKQHPNFTLVVRNAFMSQVTQSSLHSTDIKEVQKALKSFKKSKRVKLIEKFMIIQAKVKRYEDVIPAVNEFISIIQSKKNK
jgi:hypothetical protein